MGLQVKLANTIEVNENELELEICVERQTSTCTNVGRIPEPGRLFPQTSDSTVNKVKITPRENTGIMPGYWQIKITKFKDEVDFSPAGAFVREFSYSRQKKLLRIRLQGGTLNWKLTIIKPDGRNSKDSENAEGEKQTSNVTIGADSA